MTATPDVWLTPDEVATELRCSHDTVLRAIRRGDLTAVRYGARLVRVSRAELDAFLARHTTDALTARRRRPVRRTA